MDELARDLHLAKIGLIKAYLAANQIKKIDANYLLGRIMGTPHNCFPIDAIILDKAEAERDLIWLRDNEYLYKYRLSHLLEKLITLEELKNHRGLSYKEMLFKFATPHEKTILD